MRVWKWLFRGFLVLILFASALQFGVINLSDLKKTFQSPLQFILQLALFLLIHLVLTYRWKKILEELGIQQDYYRTLKDQLLSNIAALFFGNTATKEVVKSAALCRRNPNKKTIAVVSVLIDRILGLVSFLVMGFLATLPLWRSWQHLKYLSVLPYLMGLGLVLFCLALYGTPLWGQWMGRFKLKSLEGANQIISKVSRTKICSWVILGLLSPLFATAQLILFAPNLGDHLEILLVVIPLITIAQNLSFLPLGLGINQWVAFKVFEWAGAGEGEVIATAVTALQIYTIIFTLLSGAFFGLKDQRMPA